LRKGGFQVKVYRWDDMVPEKLPGGIVRRVIHTQKMTLGLFNLHKGASVSSHRHENEQLTYVLQGKAIFDIEGERIEVASGEVIHVPSGAEHSVEVIADTLSLDVFSPPRDDWR